MKSEPPVSWTALEATRLAYERTLMAWVRTAVSLISFGFTMYKFFQGLQEGQPAVVKRWVTPRTLGMIMIGVGTVMLLLANVEHWRCMKRLKTQYTDMHASLALLLGAFIAVFGVLALVAVVFRQ